MKNNILYCFFISVFLSVNMYAQSENYAKYYNKGNKLYENNFEEAEKNFRVAIDDTLSDLRATCLLYTSPSPRDRQKSRMPSSA